VGEEALPYAPFSDALRPLVRTLDPAALQEVVGDWRPELARLLPDLGRPGPLVEVGPGGRFTQARLFEGMLGLLERLARRAPLVLTLEDLHWADHSSLDLLAFLAHGLREVPIVLVATYRSDQLHRRHRLRPLLAELDRNPAVERVELRRLTRGELTDLLTDRLSRWPDPDLVDRVLEWLSGRSLLTLSLDGQTVVMHRLVAQVIRNGLARRGRLTAAYEAAVFVLDVYSRAVAGFPDRRAVRGILQ